MQSRKHDPDWSPPQISIRRLLMFPILIAVFLAAVRFFGTSNAGNVALFMLSAWVLVCLWRLVRTGTKRDA